MTDISETQLIWISVPRNHRFRVRGVLKALFSTVLPTEILHAFLMYPMRATAPPNCYHYCRNNNNNNNNNNINKI
jgi:hypothetical protein